MTSTWSAKLRIAGVVLMGLAFALDPVAAQAQECCTDHLACQDGRWCTGI